MKPRVFMFKSMFIRSIMCSMCFSISKREFARTRSTARGRIRSSRATVNCLYMCRKVESQQQRACLRTHSHAIIGHRSFDHVWLSTNQLESNVPERKAEMKMAGLRFACSPRPLLAAVSTKSSLLFSWRGVMVRERASNVLLCNRQNK